MIPRIEDILKMLQNKECSLSQAMMWINQHIELAVGEANLQDLRDMFAAKAMQAIIGTSAAPYFGRDNVEGLISENAYSIADAMLKQKESDNAE